MKLWTDSQHGFFAAGKNILRQFAPFFVILAFSFLFLFVYKNKIVEASSTADKAIIWQTVGAADGDFVSNPSQIVLTPVITDSSTLKLGPGMSTPTPLWTLTPKSCGDEAECGGGGPYGSTPTPQWKPTPNATRVPSATPTPKSCVDDIAECINPGVGKMNPDDPVLEIEPFCFINCQGDGSNNSNPLLPWDPCLFIQCGSPVQPQFPLPWDGISTEFPAQFQRGIVDAQNNIYRMWQESLTRIQTNTHRNNAASQP